MEEVTLNLHMHTIYSDGTGSHTDLAHAAIRAGLDVIIVTDHNVWVQEKEAYYEHKNKRVLVLAGEEIHDRTCKPQKNHLLIFGANRELARFAADPQNLIHQAKNAGGLTFIAHPHDDPLPLFGEDGIMWNDWQVNDFTGLEIWNGLSELKTVLLDGKWKVLLYGFFPEFIAHAPHPSVLQKWDQLLNAGKKIVAVGGSDAHALKIHFGPLRRTVFPYEFHFHAINNHLLLPAPLSGRPVEDRRLVLNALAQGNSFVGYDLPYSTRGFRFTAQGADQTASIGNEIELKGSLTFQIRLPAPAECHLIRNGEVFRKWKNKEMYMEIINQPGVYRVECFMPYLGRRRGWIYSNPIYVTPPKVRPPL